jgi:hypothetical protein
MECAQDLLALVIKLITKLPLLAWHLTLIATLVLPEERPVAADGFLGLPALLYSSAALIRGPIYNNS